MDYQNFECCYDVEIQSKHYDIIPNQNSYVDNFSNLQQSYPNIIPENTFMNLNIRSMAPEFQQYHQPYPEQNYMMQNQFLQY